MPVNPEDITVYFVSKYETAIVVKPLRRVFIMLRSFMYSCRLRCSVSHHGIGGLKGIMTGLERILSSPVCYG